MATTLVDGNGGTDELSITPVAKSAKVTLYTAAGVEIDPIATGGTIATITNPVGVKGTDGVTIASAGNPVPVTGVVTESHTDVAPATQNITAQDIASSTAGQANGQNFITGAPTAGSTASFAVASAETAKFEVTGTWTGTLAVEQSYDSGVTWVAVGLHQSGTAFTASSFTGNFIGGQNAAGATNVRIRATAAWTGTATVKVVLSLNENSVYIANNLSIQDAVLPANKLTVKSASVAALATDTAVVVALSPNNGVALLAGSAVVGHVIADTGSTTAVTGNVTVVNAGTFATQATLQAGAALIGKVGIDQTTPGTTNGVQVNAALPAGTNLIGKVGVDQTTPGTTNAVSVAQVGATTVLTGAGATGAGSQRVTVAVDASTVAGSASLPTGANTIGTVNLGTINGIATDANLDEKFGDIGQKTMAGSAPVTIASDQTAVPVSGTVTANIGSVNGLATDANLDEKFGDIGQKTMAGSTPVTIASDQSAVPCKEVRSATDGNSSVAGSATVVTILASNVNRLGGTVYNDSSAALTLHLGASASATVKTAVLAGTGGGVGGYYEVPFGYTGIITGLWASATGSARVNEFTT